MAALYRETVIVRDTLRFIESEDAAQQLVRVNVRGRIVTRSGGVLVVNKWLAVEHYYGRPHVLADEYSYHAFIRTPRPRRDLFRYDNCHGGLETLHCHRFDDGGRELDRADDIEHAMFPPLAWIIREAEEHAERLGGGQPSN